MNLRLCYVLLLLLLLLLSLLLLLLLVLGTWAGILATHGFFQISQFLCFALKILKLWNSLPHDMIKQRRYIFILSIFIMVKPKFLNGIFLVIIRIVCTNYPNTMIIVCTNYYCASKSVYKLCFWSIVKDVLKDRKNVITSTERKIRMSVFLYDVKVNLNHGMRLKTGMFFFIRAPLFLLC